jgi:F0F1-type ATP synthase assembly protein I
MALSDEERRRLEKLEKELAAEHPDLARKLQSGFTRSRSTARAIYGALGALAGFAVVIAGIITDRTIISVIGFLMLVASGHWFLSGILPHQGGEPP